jgi:hypothetical protein
VGILVVRVTGTQWTCLMLHPALMSVQAFAPTRPIVIKTDLFYDFMFFLSLTSLSCFCLTLLCIFFSVFEE